MKYITLTVLFCVTLASCGGSSKEALKYYQKGNAAYLKNDLGAAEKFYEKAAGLDPGLLNARLMMAKICYYRKQFPKAHEHLDAILGKNEDHVAALYWKARTLTVNSKGDKKDEERAVRLLQRVVELDGSHIRARALLALLYEKGEKYREAIYEYQMILQEEEALVNARANLGILYSRMGLKNRALNQLGIAAGIAKLSGIPDSNLKLIKSEMEK